MSSVVQLTDATSGTIGHGHVLVRMLTSTINPSDAITISGAYGSRTSFPFVPGFEGLGEIVATAPNVPTNAIGRRVIVIGGAGAWQQMRVVPYSSCFDVPTDIEDQAATFSYVNPFSALLMVANYMPPYGRCAVITAASSAIGSHIARLLQSRGIFTIGLTSGQVAQTGVPATDFSSVIDRRSDRWLSQVALQAPHGRVDVVFDCVGGDDALRLMGLLTPLGQLVQFGLMSGIPLPAECWTNHLSNKVQLFRLRDHVYSMPRLKLEQLFTAAFDGIRAGRLTTKVANEYHISDLKAALIQHETKPGKILIRID